MALWIGAGAGAACAFGYVNCDFSSEGPYETIDIDQCEETHKQMVEEYGEDYLTNREKMPITAYGLQYIKSIGCESTFNWEGLADEFCQSLGNYTQQIGGGLTCEDRDRTNVLRSQWCLNQDGPKYLTTLASNTRLGIDAENRIKSDRRCTKEKLRDKYDETWEKYCKAKPEDRHCICYNMKNNVCDTHPDAAGCEYYKVLEENKEAFSTREERAELEEGEEVASYNILKTKGHCRPRSCDSGYIPPDVKSDCADTYPICGKDIDIRTHTNTQIAVKCNYDPNRIRTFPDWWTEERDTSFMDRALERQPPFDKFPLNRLPVTRFPKKFNWKDRNVRYLSYYSSGSSVCLCLIIMIIMLSLKKR
jgi:hypothetical protein